MPSVSAIVLTKDSERTIEACVKALKPAVDHVIVVDTGSSDRTVQIAKDCSARVYHFEWRDDFSAARNFGDRLASTEWVVHIDSDEILRPGDVSKIREMCAKYRTTTMNPVAVFISQINVLPTGSQSELVARMYKHGTIVWKGIIHEQLYGRRGEEIDGRASDIGVMHDGYNPTAVDLSEKTARNIRLLHAGLEQEPDNALYAYFLGRDYFFAGDYKSSAPHLKRALKLMEQQNMTNGIENDYRLLIRCLEQAGDYAGAREVTNDLILKFNKAPTEK